MVLLLMMMVMVLLLVVVLLLLLLLLMVLLLLVKQGRTSLLRRVSSALDINGRNKTLGPALPSANNNKKLNDP